MGVGLTGEGESTEGSTFEMVRRGWKKWIVEVNGGGGCYGKWVKEVGVRGWSKRSVVEDVRQGRWSRRLVEEVGRGGWSRRLVEEVGRGGWSRRWVE